MEETPFLVPGFIVERNRADADPQITSVDGMVGGGQDFVQSQNKLPRSIIVGRRGGFAEIDRIILPAGDERDLGQRAAAQTKGHRLAGIGRFGIDPDGQERSAPQPFGRQK